MAKPEISEDTRLLHPCGRPRAEMVYRECAGKSAGRDMGFSKGAAKVIGTPKRGETTERLLFLKELIEAGKLKTVIERRYSLDEISEAHRHAEAGHKKGHVLIVLR